MHLSYQLDALNGILGILHALEQNRAPVCHIWGVPFWKTLAHLKSQKISGGTTLFNIQLQRYHNIEHSLDKISRVC